MENFIKYPMTMRYITLWGDWESIRELVSNAKDTGAAFSFFKEGNDLIIQDNGNGILLEHLLLGEGEHNDNTIGQFGEGMKLAFLVLLRNGHGVDVYSNDHHFVASIDTMIGKDVLKIEWFDIKPVTGTRIVIHDWMDDEYYEDRFVFSEDDMRVINATKCGMVLESESLFSKGVYVTHLEDYAFGYNCPTLTMNRDRSTVSEVEVQTKVGDIWEQVESQNAWKYFLKSIFTQSKMEKFARISYYAMSTKTIQAIHGAWVEVMGDKAVIKTTDEMAREAKHRGANVIDMSGIGAYLTSCLMNIIKTDESYIRERGGMKPEPLTRLSKEQRKNYNMIKRMASKVDCHMNVVVAEFKTDASGLCDYGNNTIFINVNVMDNPLTSGSVMIHELAHAMFYTQDMTEDHCQAMCSVGMKLSGLI